MDPASAGMTFSAPDLWPLTPTRSMPLLSKTPREVLRAMSESLGNSRVSDQHHAPQLGFLKFCHGAPRVSRAKFTEEVTSCEKRSYEKRRKSGRQDLNLRPFDPQSNALARLRHGPICRKLLEMDRLVPTAIRGGLRNDQYC
jgi:hypothetical protein